MLLVLKLRDMRVVNYEYLVMKRRSKSSICHMDGIGWITHDQITSRHKDSPVSPRILHFLDYLVAISKEASKIVSSAQDIFFPSSLTLWAVAPPA